MLRWFTFLFGLMAMPGVAQRVGFEYDARPAIEVAGRQLPNAWAGGLNASQFATMPLDADARPDLVVYDRTTSRFVTFVATTGAGGVLQWQHAPQYERLFPTVPGWFYLLDYDGDGRKDLFAGAQGGVQVWRNATPAGGTLRWQRTTASLQTEALSGGRSNVFVSPNTDTPAITDYDGDGDVDIMAFDPTGNQAVYYQNLSRQRTNAEAPPGLDYKTMQGCWGRFRKEVCNDFVIDTDCGVGGRRGAPNARPMHSGNAIKLYDIDGDGRQELIFGYVDCPNLSVLYNSGPANERAAFTRFEYDFPRLNPVRFPAFAAAFFEDVDGDGLADLIASPNVGTNAGFAFDFRASNKLYRNAGTSRTTDFQWVRNDFLQNDMLDLGENAAPALADLDGDGDLDLLVGHGGVPGTTGFRASLYHFENRGTPNSPAFALVTTDYLGLSRTDSLTYLRPTFADLDANGSPDLVLSGFGRGGGTLRWYPNGAAAGAAMQFSAAQARAITLREGVSGAAAVLVADLDADARPDLLLTGGAGNISYYRNTGTGNVPAFALVTDTYGGFGFDQRFSNASLALTDVNGDRRNRLVVGTRPGQVRVYALPLKPDQPATLIDSLPGLPNPGLGPILAAADLTADGLPDLVVGSPGGGLRFLRNTSEKVAPLATNEPTPPWAFPNPTDRYVTIYPPYAAQVDVIGLDGRRLLPPVPVAGQLSQPLDLGTLAAGVYLLRLTAEGRPTQVQRIVLGR
jgi:hypothetical protein